MRLYDKFGELFAIPDGVFFPYLIGFVWVVIVLAVLGAMLSRDRDRASRGAGKRWRRKRCVQCGGALVCPYTREL